MKRTSTLLLAIFCFFATAMKPCIEFSQSITITLNSPLGNYPITGDNLAVQVKVTSTNQVDSVYATVLSHRADLSLSGGIYSGNLSLVGLPQDTLALSITAVDHFNNRQTITKSIIYDNPPSVTVQQPLNFSVARPLIHVKAKCIDNSTGCVLKLNASTVTGIDSLEADIDLSYNEGQQYMLVVTATDKRNQAASTNIPLYVESSPYLKEYFVCQDKIWDFNYNKILTGNTQVYVQGGGFSNLNTITGLKIVNVPDSSVTHVPFSGNINYLYAFNGANYVPEILQNQVNLKLTPYGAFFLGTDHLNFSNINNLNIYDFNQNTLTELSNGSYNGMFNVNGDYASWMVGLGPDTFYIRNLQSQTNSIVPQIANNPFANLRGDLASNGTASFWVSRTSGGKPTQYDIVKYQGGSNIFVTDSTESKLANGTITDGSRVAYMKGTPCCSPDSVSLMLNDSTGTVQVARLPNDLNLYDYKINQRYLAFTNYNSSGKKSIWLRVSTGANNQLTFYGNADASIEKLSSSGNLTYFFQFKNPASPVGGRYLAYKNGTIRQFVKGFSGETFFYNNELYMAIGRVLYKVDLSIPPDSITGFSKNVGKDSVLLFYSSDFAANFISAGNLVDIRVESLPLHGQLLLNGSPVALNTVIPRSFLGNFTYRPSPGYTGSDTVTWRAFNSIAYTDSSAIVRINVVAAPLQPLVTGVNMTYCSNSGTQHGKITNMPPNGSSTTVSAKLDATALTIAADSTFSFDVTGLSGSHAIAVTLTNSGGSKTTTDRFTILTAVTPDVNVASNVTTSIDATPITLTASNAGGGGSTPLYTFAIDRNFISIQQAESPVSTLDVSPGALAAGDNWFYVRMTTSANCYTSLYGIDSIKITRVLAPATPVLAGLTATYCSNAGIQKGKITNLPANSSGITVDAKLDATTLSIAADSSFNVDPAALAAGSHNINITFTNLAGNKSTAFSFNITTTVTPDVNVSANITNVTSLANPVVVTAANAAGGGTTPLYTFAKDKAFTNILKAESSSDTLHITPSNLAVGDNWIYVRMKTNATCYTAQTNIDSIDIRRDQSTGIRDLDDPSRVINIYPNPFVDRFMIDGLNPGKVYTVTIYNLQGQTILQQKVTNRSTITVPGLKPSSSVYWLSIFDDRKQRLIGTVKLLKQ